MIKEREKRIHSEEKEAGGWGKVHFLLLALLLALIPFQALMSIRWKSATFEEGVHLAAGAHYLTSWDMEACPGYPPLTRMWTALPLLISGVNVPEKGLSYQEMYPFSFGTRFLYECNNADTVLFQGRTMVIVLSMLLGLYVFRLSRDFFGRKAAFIALILYTFSPNILAHSRLVTPDLPLSAFLFITLFYYRRAAVAGGKKNTLLAAFFALLTINTKYAGLLFFPILLGWNIVFSLRTWMGGSHEREKSFSHSLTTARRSWKILVFVFLFCLFMINAEYGFQGTFGNFREYHESLLLDEGVKESYLLKTFSQTPLLSSFPLPFPRAFVRGFDLAVYYDRDIHHPNWYLGKLYMKGEHWWHYYFVAMALKVPVPMLILFLMTILTGILFWKRNPGKKETLIFLFIPCVVFFVFFSLICQSQLGLRLILPIFPFIFTATGLLTPPFSERKWLSTAFVSILLGWYLLSSVLIHPHYLSYFNELAGGATRGIEYFADSNLDWGQDLKGLKRYMDDKGIKKIHVRYYGPHGIAEPVYYGIKIPLPDQAPRAPWAISATWLYYELFKHFRDRVPDDRIGYSIFLYYPIL